MSLNLSKKELKQYRMIISVILSVLFFLLLQYVLPEKEGDSSGSRLLIRNIIFACIFGFLPFYILPWLKWIMGHDNDLEENIDGDPKEKD